METQLDTFIFKLEKLFLATSCLSNYVGTTEDSYNRAFYSLLDDIQGLEQVYQSLEIPLNDYV